MKRTIILSALLIFLWSASSAQVQDSTKDTLVQDSAKKEVKHKEKNDEYQTLFGHNRSSGGYGAFNVGYSQIDSKQAVIFGGKFEWIVGHSLGLGFGGNGFINENHFDPYLNTDVFLTGGYGGFIIEPILLPKFPVHLSFPTLLGAGGISYITENMDYHNMVEDSEVFLIAEPSAELEFNITRHFRLALGASYRFTSPFNVGTSGSAPVSSDSLDSWTYMMTFKFGRF
jgi:opacity protein-like surface antigen